MTPVEIVRAMLAEYEQAPAPRSHTFAARRVLGDVIAALEQADTAPRLEWSMSDRGATWVEWTATVDGFSAKVMQFEGHVSGLVEVHERTGKKNVSTRVLYRNDEIGSVDIGQRIAELVIHRHRQMLDEIARVK